MPRPSLRALAVAIAVAAVAGAALAEPPLTHENLDWAAPWRWVHLDNVDPAQATVFESARRGWLKALDRDDGRRDEGLLGDGRPLFWSAQGDSVDSYLTFYPFRTWSDLDDRVAMVRRTNGVVGEDAAAAYDAGDAALVPPHLWQIWRRRAAADIVTAATDSLTELTASRARVERRQVDWVRWDDFEQCWAAVQAALAAQDYPLACRVFTNTYGGPQGDMVLMWLAPDVAHYQAAPTLADAIARQLGPEEGARLVADLDALFPARQTWEMTRRADLSNLATRSVSP